MSSANPGIKLRWVLVDSTTAAMDAAWDALKFRVDGLAPAPPPVPLPPAPLAMPASYLEVAVAAVVAVASRALPLPSEEVEWVGERCGESRPMVILSVGCLIRGRYLDADRYDCGCGCYVDIVYPIFTPRLARNHSQ